MNFQPLPKIELHLHLDCSLSYEVVRKIDPSITEDEYRCKFVAPAKCTDLADYISRAVIAITLMQTELNLRLVVEDLFNQLRADNVIYAEIRFAPLLHIESGLSARQVVQIVNDAVKEFSQKTGVIAGLILCTLRHYSEEQSLQTVHLVNEFKGTPVCGFDIAADEAGYPIDNHIKAFEIARQKNILCTAHAGEAKGADSVWETLKNFHPQRIGHGVRSVEDESLLEFLKQRNIHLEVCPTSNVQTNVYEKIQDHAADIIFRKGISMSINTDARTISDVTLSSEYLLMEEYFKWSRNHFKKCNLDAIEHAFASEEIKAGLIKKINDAY